MGQTPTGRTWAATATIPDAASACFRESPIRWAAKVKVTYAEGCKITKEGGDWWADTSHLSDPAEDGKLIAQAVEVAKAADVSILVLGGNEDTNKEGWADNHLGDRDSLDLVGRQNDLVKAVLETGKPTIVLLINSGPLSVNYIAEKVPAILEGFYLGQETGVGCRRCFVRGLQPGWQTAGQLPAFRGPVADLLQPQANRETRLLVHQQGTAVSVWLWSQLYDL